MIYASHSIGAISSGKTVSYITGTTDITSNIFNVTKTLIPTNGKSDGKVIFMIHSTHYSARQSALDTWGSYWNCTTYISTYICYNYCTSSLSLCSEKKTTNTNN